MDRRVWSLGGLVAVFAILLLGIQGSSAGIGGKTTRFKTVEIESTQYVWQLVSLLDGHVVCTALVDHPTRPSYEETIAICGDQIFPAEATATPFPTYTPGPGTATAKAATPSATTPPATATVAPTATPLYLSDPFDLANFFGSVSWQFVSSKTFKRTVQEPLPEMIVNLTVPSEPTGQLFVRISAYEPVQGEHIIGINGSLNGWPFTCDSRRCDVPVSGDSTLEFWSQSSLGDESQHMQATLRKVLTDQGLAIRVSSITPVTIFQDACSLIWGRYANKDQSWAAFPASPDELNTQKPYQYLTSRLISSNVVDATGCPGGGLGTDGAPNACGLEKAASAVVAWQNQYDVTIWDAARQFGIPPLLVKTLIEQESQFWPGNGRNTVFEYGLGQMSQAGVDVLMRWDNEQYQKTCNTVFYDCGSAYGRQTSWIQSAVRGGLLRSMNAECANCPHAIDIEKAHESVPVIARMLRASCRQVKYMFDKSAVQMPSYEDMWRFTFLSYHSGYNCLSDALKYVQYNRDPATWDNVISHVDCPGAQYYVDKAWKSLSEFKQYQIKVPDADQPVTLVDFSPTPAPTLTATPVLTFSHLRVLVYVDKNENNLPDSGELVDGVRVEVRFRDGSTLDSVTANGEAIIDLTGRPADVDAEVALPELYRTQNIRIPRDGEIPVIFRLDQPVLPPGLP